MVDTKIEEILKIAPKQIMEEEYNMLLEYTRNEQALLMPDEWGDLIKRVGCVIDDRCGMEDGLTFLEKTYKLFVKHHPNWFEIRKDLLEHICQKNLVNGNMNKAHDCMNRLVFVALADIGFQQQWGETSYFSFRPFSEYSLKDVRDQTLSLAHPREFNDPLDTLLQFWLQREIDNQQESDELALKKYFLLKKVSENIKMRCLIGSVFCKNGEQKTLTVEDLSFLMWSHYAQSHTGFCVEYKFDRGLFEIDNQKENKIQLIGDVSYTDTMNVDNSLNFKKLLFEKSDFWKYEHEMRLVQFDSTPSSSDVNKDFPTIKCENMMKAVYLGVNCSDKHRSAMLKAIGDKDIPVFQMKINNENLTRLSKVQIG